MILFLLLLPVDSFKMLSTDVNMLTQLTLIDLYHALAFFILLTKLFNHSSQLRDLLLTISLIFLNRTLPFVPLL